MNKVAYTTFIPDFEIPESSAISPTQLAFASETPGGSKSSTEGVVPPTITQPISTGAITRAVSAAPTWTSSFSGIGGTEGSVGQLQAARATLSSSSGSSSSSSSPTGSTYSNNKKFVADLTSAYERELERRGLSKEYAKYIVAQDALESNWGKSSLSKYYNFGGVKEVRRGKGVQMNTKEYDGKQMVDTKASFRRFNDLDDYVRYKIDLLGNSNYDVFSYKPDQLYTRLVTAKKKYATDPNYLSKMNKMYQSVLAIT